jgi:hypothetical protein
MFHNSQEFNTSFEMDVLKDGQECFDQTSVDISATFCFANKGMAQFTEWCIAEETYHKLHSVWFKSHCFSHLSACTLTTQQNFLHMLLNSS